MTEATKETKLPDQTETPVPSLSERIRELLPDHTHETAASLPAGMIAWSWTTRDAQWMVVLNAPRVWGIFPGSPSVDLTGRPGGEWRITGDSDTIVRRLAGVLRALDAIGGETDG